MRSAHTQIGPIVFLMLSTILPALDAATPPFLPMDETLVPLSSKAGRRLFRESSADEAFWHLAQFYATQPDLGSCGVASATMVLNALPIERPVSRAHGEFRLFTSENLFTDKVAAIVSREKVSSSGMTLSQFAAVLEAFDVAVTKQFASETSLDAFRENVKASLKKPDRFVIVNYLRRAINQESGGHISPLGAYNEESDVVLILDTSNYKYPWTWVKLNSLWRAMAEAVDSGSKHSRGFIIVSQK